VVQASWERVSPTDGGKENDKPEQKSNNKVVENSKEMERLASYKPMSDSGVEKKRESSERGHRE